MSTKRGRSTYRSTTRRSGWRDSLSSSQRALVLGGLALFLIFDVVLVGLALGANRAPSADRTQRPLATFDPTTPPRPTATATEEPAAPVVDTVRFLATTDGQVLLRSTGGTCASVPPVVERSLDAGVTWGQIPTNGVDARQVLALTSDDDGGLRLLAATGDDCAVNGFSSTDSGDSWTADPAVPPAVSYVAADGTVVVSGQPVAAPCPAVQTLNTSATRTVAACTAVVAEWDPAAAAWTTTPYAGVHALATDGDRLLYVARGVTGCNGLGALGVSGVPAPFANAAVVGCAAGADVTAPAALALDGSNAWLWVGDAFFRSADGGATWA